MSSISDYYDFKDWEITRTLQAKYPNETPLTVYIIELMKALSLITLTNAVHEIEEVSSNTIRHKPILAALRNKMAVNTTRLTVIYAVLKEAERREVIAKSRRWLLEAGWETGLGDRTIW